VLSMGIDHALGRYRDEILRWNHQISLVSRVDASAVVADQVDQCRRAWSLLAGSFTEKGFGGAGCWIDVGSGGGLPGLVWAAERAELHWGGSTMLVEPREKRAWFLSRAARAMGVPRAEVLDCRWGEWGDGRADRDESLAVVSFKALRMSDSDVLAGFGADSGFVGLRRVVVVRFLWPEAWCLEQLGEEFGVGRGEGCGGWGVEGVEILGDEQPRLLVTEYCRQV